MRQVPALVEASKLGGWLTVQDTIKPCSYHNVVQKLTTKLINRSGARMLAPQPARDPTDARAYGARLRASGFIYTSLMVVGSIDEPLPESCFREVVPLPHNVPRVEVSAQWPCERARKAGTNRGEKTFLSESASYLLQAPRSQQNSRPRRAAAIPEAAACPCVRDRPAGRESSLLEHQ